MRSGPAAAFHMGVHPPNRGKRPRGRPPLRAMRGCAAHCALTALSRSRLGAGAVCQLPSPTVVTTLANPVSSDTGAYTAHSPRAPQTPPASPPPAPGPQPTPGSPASEDGEEGQVTVQSGAAGVVVSPGTVLADVLSPPVLYPLPISNDARASSALPSNGKIPGPLTSEQATAARAGIASASGPQPISERPASPSRRYMSNIAAALLNALRPGRHVPAAPKAPPTTLPVRVSSPTRKRPRKSPASPAGGQPSFTPNASISAPVAAGGGELAAARPTDAEPSSLGSPCVLDPPGCKLAAKTHVPMQSGFMCVSSPPQPQLPQGKRRSVRKGLGMHSRSSKLCEGLPASSSRTPKRPLPDSDAPLHHSAARLLRAEKVPKRLSRTSVEMGQTTACRRERSERLRVPRKAHGQQQQQQPGSVAAAKVQESGGQKPSGDNL